MTFVVSGVSGHTGRVVAETLLDRGARVRVLVRDRRKGEAFEKRGAEVVVADLLDTAAVTAALRGAEGAYWLVPPNLEVADFIGYQAAATESLARATETSDLPHAVFLSSVGAHVAAGTGPIRGIGLAEKRFEKLRTRFTFLRAAYFMENLGSSLGTLDRGVFGSFTPADFAFDMVATEDIGRVAAEALLEGPGPSVIELSGPEKVSSNDVARLLTSLVGKPVAVAEAPVSAMAGALEGFGMPKQLAGLYQEMTEGLLSGKVAFEGTHRSVRGPTRVETVLRRLLNL